MEMNEYQRRAAETDRNPKGSLDAQNEAGMIVPLFGMAGEVGQLLSEYKKYLRDGEAHRLFKDRIVEELGDILWYVANTATKFGVDLADVADANIRKCQDRWGHVEESPLFPGFRPHLDDRFLKEERFPRQFIYCMREPEAGRVQVSVIVDGKRIVTELAELTDNHYDDDGYRFHDVFHVSYAAILGWSPILRRALKLKRRSDPKVDEVEDGGRAGAIEEGVSAYVFSYAKDHSFFDGLDGVNYEVLRAIQNMTSHLEVSCRTKREWEAAILKGYEIWRAIRKTRGGAISVNLDRATLELCPMPEEAFDD